MRALRLQFALASLLASACAAGGVAAPGDERAAADAGPPPACPDLGEPGENGEPAPHSAHHRVLVFDDDLISAEVDVRVREMPDHGLLFFALQVNLEDVWAHGGLQGDMQANWGGLTNADDYAYSGNEAAVLDAIQNGPDRLQSVIWQPARWYRYRVARGPLETFPPGEYSVLDDGLVAVDHERALYRWDFTISDRDTGVVIYDAYLHTHAPYLQGISYWTETGYGVGCNDRLTVDWSDPLVVSETMGGPQLPQRIAKSIDQSTCPLACSTDIEQQDHGGEWGTTQTFGQSRSESSSSGQLLWLRAR